MAATMLGRATLFCWLLLHPSTDFRIAEYVVEGQRRLSAEAIRAESGLSIGQKAARADFEAACRRLADTGMFRYVNYRYVVLDSPREERLVRLTLEVAEETSLVPVVLDIPGISEEEVWAWLRRRAPLAGREIPGNEQASGYYAGALGRFLAEQGRSDRVAVVFEQEAPGLEKITAVVRPAALTKIAALRFVGNSSVPAGALHKALDGVALGQDFTERTLRRLLDYNLRPLFEEQGFLRVHFPSLRTEPGPGADEVTVTVVIEEGVAFRLGEVRWAPPQPEGEQWLRVGRFPQGRRANWKEISAALARIQELWRRDGFLAGKIAVERRFEDQTATVHLDLTANKGAQFFFGELILSGLPEAAERSARRAWKLPSGSPMNEPYIFEYLRAVMPAQAGVSSVSQELRVRPGTRIVDVHITFR